MMSHCFLNKGQTICQGVPRLILSTSLASALPFAHSSHQAGPLPVPTSSQVHWICHFLCLEFSSLDWLLVSIRPWLMFLLFSGPSLFPQSKAAPPSTPVTSLGFLFFMTHIPLWDSLACYLFPPLSCMKSGNLSSLFPVTFPASGIDSQLIHSRSSINTCWTNDSIALAEQRGRVHPAW